MLDELPVVVLVVAFALEDNVALHDAIAVIVPQPESAL